MYSRKSSCQNSQLLSYGLLVNMQSLQSTDAHTLTPPPSQPPYLQHTHPDRSAKVSVGSIAQGAVRHSPRPLLTTRVCLCLGVLPPFLLCCGGLRVHTESGVSVHAASGYTYEHTAGGGGGGGGGGACGRDGVVLHPVSGRGVQPTGLHTFDSLLACLLLWGFMFSDVGLTY